MPGVYVEGAFDVAGAVVGLAARDRLWPRQEEMEAGDLLLGLPSSGPHTNGYSLIRQTVEGRDLAQQLGDGQILADALLAPHRCYLPEIEALLTAGAPIKGLAHITGGGFTDNIPRILPSRLAATVDLGAWDVPAVFRALVDWSDMTVAEAYRVFNMGIGMIAVIPAAAQETACATLADARVIGRLNIRTAETQQVQFTTTGS
jgi:phosphoribosylformylglycinamidine cyclo-ligase